MTTKRILIMTAALLLAQLSLASTSLAQSRLNELSSRLVTQANQFADASYRPSSGAFRESRNAQAAMLAHHFSGGARLFNRMVTDRVRRNDLRDAFSVLQSLATPIDGNNVDGNRWSNIQMIMADISTELNNPRGPRDSGDPRDPRDDDNLPSGSGRMTWRGSVDDDVRIVIRGGQADVETIGGTPYYNATTNFSASLPRRRVTVRLQTRRGRGEISIEQQPSRENDFAAVIRIRDTRGGASDYEFEVSW
jgi:hypothetical protein